MALGKTVAFASVVLMTCAGSPVQRAWAQSDSEAGGAAPVESLKTGFDHVRLENGSFIVGEIVTMSGGELQVKTQFGVGEVVKVKWSEVANFKTDKVQTFVLANGSSVTATAAEGEGGKIVLSSAGVEGAQTVALESVVAINPPPAKPSIVYKGGVNFGATINDGNTQNKTAAFNAEFEARSEQFRLTLRGAWNYAQDKDGLTARNTRGSIKYDQFITKRFFAFASAFFEEDRFQDLNLRTALSAGPGYQLVNAGDLEGDLFKGLESYVEAGVAFFDEDFRTGMDDRYVAGRWAFKITWPIVPGVVLFHNHEGYPGLEDIKDLYIITEQGVRLSILKGLVATLQANYRWDATPSPGFERDDALYLVTLGYAFEY